MEKVNFCLSCGQRLETRNIGGADRKACPSCDFVHWGDFSIGVGACVFKDGKVLLVRRAQDPGKGRWTTPGGYIEQLEFIEQTIEREIEEETGIRARAKKIIAIRDLPRAVHNVYIAFSMEYLDGEPQADGIEVDRAGFFSWEEMQTMNVAPLTAWLVDVALHQTSLSGLVMDKDPIVPLEMYGLFRSI
ncbi:NUDIX domain-containing protein [Ectobacillus panaciterrae]|uniref:NUDIX domain-containing protein n=1 Tax=Ectobacillus panaciterrae TaxID=363872 RepID=UPI00041E8CC5|nr:NUDIX domain-containing protein [Ectobacillus panaciterrae]